YTKTMVKHMLEVEDRVKDIHVDVDGREAESKRNVDAVVEYESHGKGES
ncbi:hypothetical protein A2U01_0063618, partial [Trifolium medium]|nr:hypothetical protein [Trifolium medium]